ncbi:MerR family transcriptional regulator [Ralstonia sp. 25C]|uniref:MerR family transcriptional regulator n=1 Tax=Ralstonia sp. 25C TaxID=3447363 RepID=UPI003F754D5D
MAADKHTERVNLPPIPAKRYFTIGEVSDLCAVKPHVLRYWEQEFTQLKPVKRRGNRRYYQHHEVLLIRRIRELLYEQGFTINGARNRLDELRHGSAVAQSMEPEVEATEVEVVAPAPVSAAGVSGSVDVLSLRRALTAVLDILRTDKP